jgi:hypothetical protein
MEPQQWDLNFILVVKGKNGKKQVLTSEAFQTNWITTGAVLATGTAINLSLA